MNTNSLIGKRIKLICMVGENLPYGLLGTVSHIDDIGQLHMTWDNGSTLAINTEVDEFEVL